VRPVEPETNALAALLGGRVDIATFFSPSALSGLAIMLSDVRQSQGIASSLTDVLAQLTVACIGPATAKAADSLGVRVDIIPEEHTIEGMCEALQKYLNKR
jgi:uroporphyrinogen III methyltransferase/synthase